MSKAGEIAEVIYEYAALPDWAPLEPGMVMPLNTPVCIAVRWANTGSESLKARAYLKVTDPYGGASWVNPDLYYATLSPGEDIWIYFDNVVFEALGQYVIDVSLVEYGETEPLDSRTVLVTAGYPDTPPIDGGITPDVTQSLAGMALVLGLMAAVVGVSVKMSQGLSDKGG